MVLTQRHITTPLKSHGNFEGRMGQIILHINNNFNCFFCNIILLFQEYCQQNAGMTKSRLLNHKKIAMILGNLLVEYLRKSRGSESNLFTSLYIGPVPTTSSKLFASIYSSINRLCSMNISCTSHSRMPHISTYFLIVNIFYVTISSFIRCYMDSPTTKPKIITKTNSTSHI